MILAGTLALVICLLVLAENILLLAGSYLRTVDPRPPLPEILPKIAVLVACRDEEHTLSRCLDALLALDYPHDRIEIWAGNDNSTDNTGLILRKYAGKFPRIRIMTIDRKLGKAIGKANVLAHLARQTSASHLFCTDADTAVPPGWINNILPHFKGKTGMVVGTTVVSSQNLWGLLQQSDWALAQAMLKVVSDFFRPVTGMGNNMAVSKEAYLSTGGFEALPASIVEDFELFRAIRKCSFTVSHLVMPLVTAETLPVAGIKSLLYQRRRWMDGAVQIHWILRILLAFQALFYPALIVLLLTNWPLALGIGIIKMVLQSLIIRRFLDRAGKKSHIISLVLFEFYSAALSLSLLFFYFLPVKVRWKNRKY
jgi:cellulose synthase/poly-beta-1,6-N-acetylglucosamine synthase-like glycosyltransferase